MAKGLHIVPMYNFIGLIMAYSVAGFLIFAGIYGWMGMSKHFNLGSTKGSNAEHALWHSWCVQSTAMDELTPKTRAARIAQGIQVAIAWLPMIVLLSPWDIQGGK